MRRFLTRSVLLIGIVGALTTAVPHWRPPALEPVPEAPHASSATSANLAPDPGQAPGAAVAAASAAFASAIAAAKATAPGDRTGLRRATAPLLVHLDLPRITRLLLGRHWRGATGAERRAVQDALVEHVLTRFAPRLRSLDGWTLELLPGPSRPSAADRARVPVAVSARGLPTVRLDLWLARRDDRWRLYDARFQGVGLIGLQRPLLGALAADHGIDGLVSLLRGEVAPAGAAAGPGAS